MTKTDEIRAMLDERGVEVFTYDRNKQEGKPILETGWDAGDVHAAFYEYPNEGKTTRLVLTGKTTPEQAIAATLGPGTCEDLTPEAAYCFTCSECGHIRRSIQGWNSKTDREQDGFRFCPNCGREVKA